MPRLARRPRGACVVAAWVAALATGCELRNLDYLGNGQAAVPIPGCSGSGWCELPNTMLSTQCPPDDNTYAFQTQCERGYVLQDSAVADLAGERLVIWGGFPGGNTGYDGNEVYALSLGSPAIARLDDPSPIDSNGCPTDGRPPARQTYDGLAYIATTREMFAFGGGADCGGALADTWTLDLSTQPPSWTKHTPPSGGPQDALLGATTDYDAVTDAVLLETDSGLWSFSAKDHAYELLSTNVKHDLGVTGRIDPKRRLFVVLGEQIASSFELTSGRYARSDLTLSGCDPLVQAGYLGLAYDPVIDRFVAWWPTLGSTVYVLDMDTMSCMTQTISGGPAPSMTGAALGHFRYFPAFDGFTVMNDVTADAFVLRLGP